MSINIPSMLSFERKLETSDGLMFAGNWDDMNNSESWPSIPIITRQNRSTQSAYGIDDSKKTMPNPVSSDSDDANLPMDKDTVKISFSLRVIGSLGNPFACNSPEFADKIEAKVEDFKKSEGIDELSFRYAYNIANGRFLWRNRVGAEEVAIKVGLDGEEPRINFKAYEFSLNDFDKNSDNEGLKKIAAAIKKGFTSKDENSFVFLKVDAYVKLGKGQHVFPSQEMNMGEKKKKLFRLDGCAAMHNVKIGNAIRTIDTWYGDTMLVKDNSEPIDIEAGIKYPIAIEPYGSVTQHGRAYRHNTIDLYTLMLSWVNDESIENDQKNYVVGNLIRGGVFGGDSDG